MTDEVLPVPADSLNGADRDAAVSRLRDLFGAGELSYERFSTAIDQSLAATTHEELEAALVGIPSLVRLSPATQRLSRPVVIEARMSSLDLGTGFQLGAETTVIASIGSVCLDLTAATWDSREVDLHLEATTGSIDVIVPRGVLIQLVRAKGQVVLENIEPPVPGAPRLRIEASARTGVIRISHAAAQVERKAPRRRWLRRG